MAIEILGIGITGRTLTDLERKILRDTAPGAVVLFGRNVESEEQLRELVAEIKAVAKRPPLLMIDQEGGRVDRLRQLIPGLPSAEIFESTDRPAELAGWCGEVMGRALRWFDIEVDLAPVVDVRCDPAPRGLERRTFSGDPAGVIELAGAFQRGLHRAGVAACIKHWPGIGAGSADPHYGATVIDVSLEDLQQRDLPPFRALGPEAAGIMIGHGTYPRIEPESGLPASLSRRLTTELLREGIGFDGIAVSDDMEMHAVSDLGSYDEIAERALMAGNDLILFCSHVETIPSLESDLRARIERNPAVRRRFEEALVRVEGYRSHCERLRAAAPVATDFDAVLDETARFLEALKASRPAGDGSVPESDRRKSPRTLGKGRSGREEWT
jgi:beta-N-acetylhexosaminidase